MLVKVYKKALLVLAVVMLLGSATMATSSDSALVGGSSGDDSVANSALVGGRIEPSEYTKTVPGGSGIEVTYKGIWKHSDAVEVYYTVVAPMGGRVSIDGANTKLIDANDVVINQRHFQGRVHINNINKDTEEFLPGEPYEIMLRYGVSGGYLLTPTFKSAVVVINGLPVEFEDVSVSP